ncbi:TPA: aminotransferase class I/II-fold pyridoxal phosphate-dependent enzyme [Candidatus Bathyarchaeota archaeon]|nr:aminotransferase class I/II-fold pyridoxal phosphate-dependent enzyme [Candidatus Bathyarchaeota archaeon]
MKFEFSENVKRLPLYIFAELEKIINEKKRTGIDIISLSIGDPDLPPPPFVLEALKEESSNPRNHNYSLSQGEPEFREAVVEWYKNRFGVDLDPKKEVIALIGSKEGIANIVRAFINPGDRVLVPNPAYPVYANGGTILSGGIPVSIPLLEENEFRPSLDKISNSDIGKAKIMFLNYPNNPTGSVLDETHLREIVDFAKENNIILCYDNAYSEVTFDGYKAPSVLQIAGAVEVAIEFHTCSKTFNMTGDRIGFAVGNSKLIEGLLKVKSQVDSGPPVYIQKVAAKALRTYINGEPPEYVRWVNETYKKRRDLLADKLTSLGFKCRRPKATFYIWLKCGGGSIEFSRKLLDTGVLVAPGIGFGKYGEGYVRISITQPLERIKEACERIAKVI